MKNNFHRQNGKKGMALLIAVIASSALLLASIAISDIAFKQQIISYSGRESKVAFYAADAGLECALYHDLKVDDFFPIPGSSLLTAFQGGLNCAGLGSITPTPSVDIDDPRTTSFSYSMPDPSGISGATCVFVQVTKRSTGIPASPIETIITSRGYNTTCNSIGDDGVLIIEAGSRNVERALEVKY